MSVPPRRGLNRRPARGFGKKKVSSLGKAPSRLTRKKRFSISDSFKRGEERRRIRKIKREQEKKLRGTSTKSPLVVEPKRPKTPKTPKILNKTTRRNTMKPTVKKGYEPKGLKSKKGSKIVKQLFK